MPFWSDRLAQIGIYSYLINHIGWWLLSYSESMKLTSLFRTNYITNWDYKIMNLAPWQNISNSYEHGAEYLLQLDLGYPAISYPDISIIRPQSCIVYCLFLIHFHIKSCSKQKRSGWISVLFHSISNKYRLSNEYLHYKYKPYWTCCMCFSITPIAGKNCLSG